MVGHTHEWVTSHTWMSHVTHMNESRHTHMQWYWNIYLSPSNNYERVTSHTWMSHVHTQEIPECWYIRPSPSNNQELAHNNISRVSHMKGSRHSLDWVMSHTWMSHVTHMDKSCHTHICSNVLYVDTYARRPLTIIDSWMSDVTHMKESCHTHEWVTPLNFELASGVSAYESSLLF